MRTRENGGTESWSTEPQTEPNQQKTNQSAPDFEKTNTIQTLIGTYFEFDPTDFDKETPLYIETGVSQVYLINKDKCGGK